MTEINKTDKYELGLKFFEREIEERTRDLSEAEYGSYDWVNNTELLENAQLKLKQTQRRLELENIGLL